MQIECVCMCVVGPWPVWGVFLPLSLSFFLNFYFHIFCNLPNKTGRHEAFWIVGGFWTNPGPESDPLSMLWSDCPHRRAAVATVDITWATDKSTHTDTWCIQHHYYLFWASCLHKACSQVFPNVGSFPNTAQQISVLIRIHISGTYGIISARQERFPTYKPH